MTEQSLRADTRGFTEASAWWQPAEFDAERETQIERLERWELHSRVLPVPETRQVTVYLPRAYAQEPLRRFPVFYLHDGQNVFDPRTAFIEGHTWRAGATADRLAAEGAIEPVILVGVANAGLRRMAEYTPTRDFKLGGGEGARYGRLLLEELKPLVDTAYRTKPDAASTAVGGSSLGGLISLWLALENRDVFGKAAVMSPSIWWDQRSVLALVSRLVPRPAVKLWMDIGSAEGARHVRDAAALYRLLVRAGWREGVDLTYFLAEGAAHTEDAWAERFGRVLRFLFPATGQ